MTEQNSISSNQVSLKNLYDSVLDEYLSLQVSLHNSERVNDTPPLKHLEDKEVELGLRLDEIENQIINSDYSNYQERLDYLKSVLEILARRESLTDNNLILRLEKCLAAM